MTIAQDPHARAIIASLETDSITVGDGEGKKTGTPPNESIVPQQVILHMVPGGTLDGAADDPEAWGDVRFRLTAVGRTASEARDWADRADIALADHPPTVTGRVIQRVRPLEPWGSTEIDHDVTPPLFYTTRLHGMWSFPT